jgi:hypothetical protein
MLEIFICDEMAVRFSLPKVPEGEILADRTKLDSLQFVWASDIFDGRRNISGDKKAAVIVVSHYVVGSCSKDVR